MLKENVRLVLYRLKARIRHYPFLFFPIIYPLVWFRGIRNRQHGIPVTRRTELVIEGFQRSGNSFAVTAFELVQPRQVVTAHNFHAPAQVKRAIWLRKPILILIRKPVDAVLSDLIWSPYVPARYSVRAYINFYSSISRYRGHFIVSSFEETISDFGNAIERINKHFGTHFQRFEHTEKNLCKVFARIDERNKTLWGGSQLKIPKPTEQKEKLKKELRKKLERPDIESLLDQADALYRKFTQDDRQFRCGP
jgi:hypothetical protein